MDNIKEALRENYEAALLALLLDDFAQAEGGRLLAEKAVLEHDPMSIPPSGLEERGLKTIKKAFRKRNRTAVAKVIQKVLSRVAVIVLCLNFLFFIPFFSVEAFRVDVLNMALDYQNTHTTVQFESETSAHSAWLTPADVQAVLPDSFVLEASDTSSDYSYAIFSGPDGQVTWESYSIQATTNIDTEGADYMEEISVSTFTGLLVEKDGQTTVIWGDTIAEKTYCIVGTMEKEALLEIVDALTE
jgi:hypothetical protein